VPNLYQSAATPHDENGLVVRNPDASAVVTDVHAVAPKLSDFQGDCLKQA
jgi:hypothetical protein